MSAPRSAVPADGPWSAPPPSFAGIDLKRPLIMGVVNVTPDSFSDGGETLAADAAIERGLKLIADGADMVDVGGESTRPGAVPPSVGEELRRVLPVVRALAAAGSVVSIDTRRAEVMAAAIEAGAAIVNDVTALGGDPRSLSLVAESGVAAVLMHMQGDPQTMQRAPRYRDAAGEVAAALQRRIAACEAVGIGRERVAIDPGIGFGKTVEHNLDLLARLDLCRRLGCAVVVGVSRKTFIACLDRHLPPKQRLGGSLAAGLWAAAHGANILRVHDVAETRQALVVWRAIADTADRATGR